MHSLPLGRRRLATLGDALVIYDLVNESMSKNFRIRDVKDVNMLIESSTVAIVQLSDKDVVIGFLAAKDHPMLPAVHPSAWEHYIWTRYKTVDMSARNTLFIHLLCWSKSYSGRDIVDNLLRSMFLHDSYLMSVAMIKNLPKYPLLMPGQSRCEGSFRRISTSERGVPSDILPVLFVADRAEVCPRLRVRRAVEEDNDDLVPIINQHSSRLRELYGEFYISELISRHPESERVLLVGEHKELAVGVMILNTVINYEALEESFDLSPFAGLRQLDAKPTHYVTRVSSDMLLDAGDNEARKYMPSSAPASTHNLGFEKPDVIKKKLSWQAEKSLPRKSGEDLSICFPFNDDDEDEIDFDIVNITTDLLRIPRPLSVELNIEFLITDENGAGKDVMTALQEKVDNNTKLKKIVPVSSDKNLRATVQNQFEVVRYSGKPNAFLLEVFAMHPDYDERHGYDILQATFELFPDRDYIILCLPSNQPTFPLIEHFTLVTPKHTREKFTNQSLYVAHVNSVREHVTIRCAEAYDFPAMNHILESVSDKQMILHLLEKSLHCDSLDAFALLSENQPVGVVILGPLDNCVGVRTQYDLEPQPRNVGTDGAILAGVLSPALEPHARWYLRDLIRRSKYYHLFWACHVMPTGNFSTRNVMSLTGKMVPVAPHRRSVPNIAGVKGLDKVWITSAYFSLWTIETCLTWLPKVDVNTAIVVVGASRTGLAFIETLLMGPASHYLTFTNITLVSEHGLSMLADCMPAAETCVPRGGRYTVRYLKSIPIAYYVDCITGVMVGIDRKKKFIRMKKGVIKYYDDLVLTCGVQFQHPDYLAESFAHSKKMSKGQPCERMLMDDPKYLPDRVPSVPELPDNVFVINCPFEANICFRRLLSMVNNPRREERLSATNRVIVYGDYVESYSTLAALLELGLTPHEIAFVEPFPPCEQNTMRVNCFNDEIVRVFDLKHYVESYSILAALLEMGLTPHEIAFVEPFPPCEHIAMRVNCFNDNITTSSRRYSILAALLKMGLTPHEIAFVEPYPPCEHNAMRVNCFNDKIIDERAQMRIRELGIHVFRECRFVSWRWKGSRISGFDVMSPLHSIYIPCFALFYYGFKAINYHAFKAISESGLVYDGGLVVDPTFMSNDPHVYGAGRCVQYSRRLHAQRNLHRYYCSEDVGEALANIFLHHMDPFVMADKECDFSDLLPRYRSSLLNRFPHPSIDPVLRPSLEKNRKWQPVMEFQSPVTYWATLPGPLYYMRLRAPGEDIPMEVRLTLPHQGHSLTTDKDGNYFELRLNEFHSIDAITCLAKKGPPHYDILSAIYGIHESLFNKMLARYVMNKIDDFYDYFMQPWVAAIYLDSFGHLLRHICRQNVGTVYDLVKSHFALDLDDDISDDIEDLTQVKSPSGSSIRTCISERSCAFDPGDTPILGSVHSVIERFLKTGMAADAMPEAHKYRHFPSECGQSEILHNEAKAFWAALSGERIVIAHLARFLDRNFVPNPQYAKIKPNLI